MAKQKGRLFLLPSPIHENGLVSISPEVIGIIHSLDHFIVEKARTARRFVSLTKHPEKIETLHFEEMPVDDANDDEIEMMLKPCLEGRNIGLLSEAGSPAIADPGSHYVRVAQKLGIQIVPLSGPSSLMMALMAS
ncbi:MAG: SAM-dependent methyltransferase, partial [Saprospiraceae bacterium]